MAMDEMKNRAEGRGGCAENRVRPNLDRCLSEEPRAWRVHADAEY